MQTELSGYVFKRRGGFHLKPPSVDLLCGLIGFLFLWPGNAGRNILFGPGLKNLDFSSFKNFRLSEKVQLQFRREFFNLTNTPSFGLPSSGLGTSTFGKVDGTANIPRQIQFALGLAL